MTRYIYYAYDQPSDYDLKHFSFPFKFNFPKIKTPKINTKPAEKAVNELKEKASNTLNDLGKSVSKKEREWKKHKWIDRKRDKNGKWIYDYGNGFPDEKKSLGMAAKLKDIYKDPAIKRGDASSFFPDYMDPDIKSDIDDIRKSSDAAKFIKGLLTAPLKSGISNIQYGAGLLKSVIKNKQAEDIKAKSKIDKNSGLHLKEKPTSKEYDLKHVNPSYSTPDNGGKANCYACSVAYDMRRRGFEVTATEDRNGANVSTVTSMYKNADPISVIADDPSYIPIKNGCYNNTGLTDAVNRQMRTEPEGSRGIAMLVWAGSQGGHVVNYEIENGKANIYDAQSGQKVDISYDTNRATSFTYFRTDNLEPNMNNVKKVVN